MKWLDNFKIQYGRNVLAGKYKQSERIPSFCNLKDAKRIGIIYNATELSSFNVVKELVKRISDEKTRITILGYVNSKELVDHYLYRKGFDFFYKSNLNWYHKPDSPITDKFIQEPFDILINLSLDDHYPIQYITALSPAKFKAGRFSKNDPYLDLMIDIEKEKETMRMLHAEVASQSRREIRHKDIETEINKKTETEIQLNFLINQLLHYLSIIKQN